VKRSSRFKSAAAIGAFLASFLTVSPVLAQPSGVHIDPGGPAGKEYDVPATEALDQTEAQAPSDPSVAPGGASGGGGPSAPGTDGRLFGVGIEPPVGALPGGRVIGQSSLSDAPHSARGAPPATRAGDRPRWSDLVDDNSGGSVPLAVIPIVVLIAAGALALALRRGTTPA